MAVNFETLPVDGSALGDWAQLATATVLLTSLISLAVITTLAAPLEVDETAFEASAAADPR